jgi:hypothetical protein
LGTTGQSASLEWEVDPRFRLIGKGQQDGRKNIGTHLSTQSRNARRNQTSRIRGYSGSRRTVSATNGEKVTVARRGFGEDRGKTRRERNRRGIVLPQFPYVDWRPQAGTVIGEPALHLALKSTHFICCYLLHRQRVRLMLTTEHGGRSPRPVPASFCLWALPFSYLSRFTPENAGSSHNGGTLLFRAISAGLHFHHFSNFNGCNDFCTPC